MAIVRNTEQEVVDEALRAKDEAGECGGSGVGGGGRHGEGSSPQVSAADGERNDGRRSVVRIWFF